jgi:hypothetical protein
MHEFLKLHARSAWFILLWPVVAFAMIALVGFGMGNLSAGWLITTYVVLLYPIWFAALYLASWFCFSRGLHHRALVLGRIPELMAVAIFIFLLTAYSYSIATKEKEKAVCFASFSNPMVAAIEVYSDDDDRFRKRTSIESSPVRFLNVKNTGGTSWIHGGLPADQLQGTPLYVAMRKDDFESAKFIWKRGGRLSQDEKVKARAYVQEMMSSPVFRAGFESRGEKAFWTSAIEDR